jgi:hypothetical protein
VTTLLEPIGDEDEVIIGGVAPGSLLLPTVVYLRMLDQGTEDETRQVVLAECDDGDCSMRTLTIVFSQTANTNLNTLPVLATDENDWPVIAFHTCPLGCKPQQINVLRCAERCAQAFPNKVIGVLGETGWGGS